MFGFWPECCNILSTSDWRNIMAEISSAGINNYVSQQAAQHTTQQAAQTAGSDNTQNTRETGKSPASQPGVIVQISKEGRDLAIAARAADNGQSVLISNKTHKDLQTVIVDAKQRQSEIQEDVKQSDVALADQQNREIITKDVMAA